MSKGQLLSSIFLVALVLGPGPGAALIDGTPEDPNIWFGNVEQAAAKVVGRETVHYVANIYKYYIAYRLWEEHHKEKGK